MGVMRVLAVTVLLAVLCLTFPAQVALASVGYLRIVEIKAPESVVLANLMTLSIMVEWSVLHTFSQRSYPEVRVEICEGTDPHSTTCTGIGFAPSEDGEAIRDVHAGSKTYTIEVKTPEQAQIWHLTAIFEIRANLVPATQHSIWRGPWAVVSSGGYDSWQNFDVMVKPNAAATLSWRSLLTESFEQGSVGDWKAEGFVNIVDKHPFGVSPSIPEGHSGRFAAWLGLATEGPDFPTVQPGTFMLQRDIVVTPGSILKVTFWYRAIYPFGWQSPSKSYKAPFNFSITSTAGILDQVTLEVDGTEHWRNLTRTISVPLATSNVILEYRGTGGSSAPLEPNVWARAFELDDISVAEGTFSAPATTMTATIVTTTATIVTSTASQRETSKTTTASTSATQSETSRPPAQMVLDQWPYLAAIVVLVLAGVVAFLTHKGIGQRAPAAERTEEPCARAIEVHCYYCGAPMPSDAGFCRECGKKQKGAASQ